jgi:hypothetical protein
MEQKFYIAIDGQPAGPFTIEELKSKKIQRETLQLLKTYLKP